MIGIGNVSLEVLLGAASLLAGVGILCALSRMASYSRHLEAEELRRSQQRIREQLPAQSPTHSPMATSTTWQGFRRFVVTDLKRECQDVVSVVLSPEDERPVAPFLPGQFVTVRAQIPGERTPTVRCYSLSSCFSPKQYRISVKAHVARRQEPEVPPGKMSGFLTGHVRRGDVLELQAPRGDFHLLPDTRPAVLVGAGIGVTPLLCMVETLIAEGSGRPIVLFYGVRNGLEHPFHQHLRDLAARNRSFFYVPCYSQPLVTDQANRDYRFRQRVDVELIAKLLPGPNFPFYLCGPSTFMGTLVSDLKTWGVRDEDLHFEAFGPSTVKSVTPRTPAPHDEKQLQARVVFNVSQLTVPWSDEYQSILELADGQGISLPSGCRAGNCGMCATKVLKGKVRYAKPGSARCHDGECLACLAHPDAADLVLEA